MGSTITLQNTHDWVQAFLVQRPTTGVGGVANEPFLTCANKIMQTILSAPFRWAWNRKEINFPVSSIGNSDFTQAISDWGWLEKAMTRVATGNPPSRELSVHEVLTAESKVNAPGNIAQLLDDNAGNITFRLSPPIDQAYTLFITYQKAPILATDLTKTWAPIPDRFSFLYEQGMMAMLQGMYAPQLYALNMEMFFRQLVGSAQGLSETEKAIFIEDKLRVARTEQAMLQQGKQR